MTYTMATIFDGMIPGKLYKAGYNMNALSNPSEEKEYSDTANISIKLLPHKIIEKSLLLFVGRTYYKQMYYLRFLHKDKLISVPFNVQYSHETNSYLPFILCKQ